ncbi:hypothetical protein U1Q18_052800 [Sarracenia purpurea var. burkii]
MRSGWTWLPSSCKGMQMSGGSLLRPPLIVLGQLSPRSYRRRTFRNRLRTLIGGSFWHLHRYHFQFSSMRPSLPVYQSLLQRWSRQMSFGSNVLRGAFVMQLETT